MNAMLRKTEVDLTTLGTGVILFGAWAFIKLALTVLLYGNQYTESLSGIEITIFYIIILVFAALIFLLHFYIGISARGDGKGKRKTVLYMILLGLVIFVDSLALIAEIVLMFFSNHGLLNLLITLLIDVTSFVIHFELFVNAIKIRVLRSKEAQA